DSVEEESNDDGESDDVDEHESDEDKVEEVNASPSALDSGESEADEMDATAGNDSEGEAIDASLVEVLKTRRACEKALKSPGAKRNWRTTVGTERVGTVPKVVIFIH
ncbi:unnamed protein product, partial [Hydatigera taeniaeformis]|uniref:FACT complex subunit n=1 Tax=Hydatigena taeniaeformis TaxID=6205 RepID=A0A0R3WY73_HYDTA